MVLYYTSTAVDPPANIHVGKDKFENEELIKYGWEEDFHVDNLSSAHIYLRLPEQPSTPNPSPSSWTSIPQPLLTDLAQLTKANSIEGNKKDNITVIYTPWSNLKKDGSMATGQVSFHDPKLVKKVFVAQRENAIVNRLNKTKREVLKPELAREKEDRGRELRKRSQAAQQARKKEEAKLAKERHEKKWQKDHAYDDIFDEDAMEASSNQNREEGWEEDFM